MNTVVHKLNIRFSEHMHNSCRMVKFTVSVQFVFSWCFVFIKACMNASAIKHKITVIPVKFSQGKKKKRRFFCCFVFILFLLLFLKLCPRVALCVSVCSLFGFQRSAFIFRSLGGRLSSSLPPAERRGLCMGTGVGGVVVGVLR